MKPNVARLILMVLLFFGWLGYLGYLVVCRPHTPDGLRGAFEGRALTLSRPQLLVSTLDVVAEVSDDESGTVVVKEVLFPKTASPVKPGDTLHVANLDLCHPVADPVAKDASPPPDFNGPGLYLLPLQRAEIKEGNRYQVVPTPPSPGFPSSAGISVGPPRIYPATRKMLAEYGEIAKP